MGLFDRKYCDVCGRKIGILGGRKLNDGEICGHCEDQLSPWFPEGKRADIQSIKEQLKYREENKKAVSDFSITYEYGDDMKLLVDEDGQTFVVTDEYYGDVTDLDDANPDVISFDDVVECNLSVDEEKTEVTYDDDEGNTRHYNPRRYECEYTFNIEIVVDHPYFSRIQFPLNDDPVYLEFSGEDFDPEGSPEYAEYLDQADEIIELLAGDEDAWEDQEEYDGEEREEEVFKDEHGNPIQVVTCPWCGSRTKVTYNGRCENCDGDLDI